MKLYHTPTSPFVRKVMVAAHELGLETRIVTTFLRPTPLKSDEALSKDNPLSKIPVLVLEDGSTLYDSRVICEYLDSIADGRTILPGRGARDRFDVLRTQALCDGILEAGVQVFYERQHRPKELQWEPWITGQSEKVRQGLDALEATFARSVGGGAQSPNLGHICAAVTVGWLEFRNVIGDIRSQRPKLFAFYDAFRERPSMKATAPHA